MNLHCILQTVRKMYVREQSQEENFQGKNHVFILNHAPFVPVSDNRMYKIYKSLLQRAFHHSHRRAQHHTEYQTLSACHYESYEVRYGKTGRGFREYKSGITIAVHDVTAVLMEGISFGIPSFTLLTRISWEFYCKQEKLSV